jgi:peptidylprolyl isomerase
MKRTLVLAVALASLLTGCSSGGPTASVKAGGGCSPSGKGSTDLTTKPTPAYLKDPEPTETTVHDIVCGTGEEAKNGSKIEVKYLGVLYKDGKEFDSSWSRGKDDTLPFTVGSGVIPGFTKAALGMKVGGRREVVIPSKDGYGDQGSGPIPGGATLVFVVDLVKVVPPPTPTPCSPSGTGTTDLTKKPVITVPTTPAPTATTTVDIVCGTGPQANDGSAVKVKYVGVLYKGGKEFDSSWKRGPSETLPFTVGTGVIPGFSTGVNGMKVGGRRMIVIPSKEGYGDTASGSIPAGSTLIFVIDLVSVT